jgi:pimeloyl-ACP methyl ester carboxylesterase
MLESMAGQTFADEELASVTCPVLCLAAEQDHLCPPDAMRAVAARLPTARFAVLSDTGHSAYYETPAAWNSTVLEFLAIA